MGKSGSEGGGWKRTEMYLASPLPYILSTCRLNDMMPLPDPVQQLIEQLKEQLPARSEKAIAKKAKAKQDEEKRKTAGSKIKTPVKAAPQKAEKPKPTSMNLFDMFDQKS
jgi:hypothetical protein